MWPWKFDEVVAVVKRTNFGWRPDVVEPYLRLNQKAMHAVALARRHYSIIELEELEVVL